MSTGSEMFWEVRGGGGPAEYGEGENVQGESKKEDTTPIMRVGAHRGLYDGASDAYARDGDIHCLEPASGQSDITTAPCA